MVEDGDDIRYYKFNQNTTKLVYVNYTLEKENLFAKFEKAFGKPDIKNDTSFWYNHIGIQHITLASAKSNQWSPWEYELSISEETKD